MLDIKELYLKDYIDQEITVSGWIKNHRKKLEELKWKHGKVNILVLQIQKV